MTYKGIACFAALNPKFPTRRVLKAFPKGLEKPCTAILYELFGNDWTFVKKFCSKFSDRDHCIEWHLCFRNPISISEMKLRIDEILTNMQIYGNANTKFIVCPVLEDDCSNVQFKRIYKKLKKNYDFLIVRNPCMGEDSIKFCDFEEHHGKTPKYKKRKNKRIYNPDGVSVDFEDGDKYFNRFSVDQFKQVVNDDLFMWIIWYAPLQGFKNCSGWTDKPPIEKRKYKISGKAIRGMRSLLED